MLDGGVGLAIVRNELHGVCAGGGGVLLNEIDEREAVRAMREVEVHSFRVCLDGNGILVHSVLEDELLKEEQCALMFRSLTDLNNGVPLRLARRDLGADLALLPRDDELDLIGLLDDGVVEELFLQSQLELQALGVRLSPEELGVGQVELSEALDLLETDSHELARLEGGACPELWGLEIAIALGAVDQDVLLDQITSDVDVRLNAADAHVGRVFGDDETANATLDVDGFRVGVVEIHFFFFFFPLLNDCLSSLQE